MPAWLLLIGALVISAAFVFNRYAPSPEPFVLQAPIPDTTRKGYDMAVVSTYCECAQRCANDDACGAFTYAESSGDGLSTCALSARRPADTDTRAGSTLTYVSDRCDETEVS